MNALQQRIWLSLTPRGRQTLETLIVTLCADDEFVLSRVRLPLVVARAEKHVSELPFIFFVSFKVVLFIMEYALFPFGRKFTRFSKMDLEARLRYLEAWEHSRLAVQRNLFKLVKALAICHIFSEHQLLNAIGYGDAINARIGKTKS